MRQRKDQPRHLPGLRCPSPGSRDALCFSSSSSVCVGNSLSPPLEPEEPQGLPLEAGTGSSGSPGHCPTCTGSTYQGQLPSGKATSTLTTAKEAGTGSSVTRAAPICMQSLETCHLSSAAKACHPQGTNHPLHSTRLGTEHSLHSARLGTNHPLHTARLGTNHPLHRSRLGTNHPLHSARLGTLPWAGAASVLDSPWQLQQTPG